ADPFHDVGRPRAAQFDGLRRVRPDRLEEPIQGSPIRLRWTEGGGSLEDDDARPEAVGHGPGRLPSLADGRRVTEPAVRGTLLGGNRPPGAAVRGRGCVVRDELRGFHTEAKFRWRGGPPFRRALRRYRPVERLLDLARVEGPQHIRVAAPKPARARPDHAAHEARGKP